MILRTLLILLSPGGATLAADEDGGRILFNFENVEAAKQWQSVNDGVMGGRSEGQFKIVEDKTMQFFGTLSLERNGGVERPFGGDGEYTECAVNYRTTYSPDPEPSNC